MLDPDTFLTALYVTVDDCCKMRDDPPAAHPGAPAALSPSEVVTLALFAEWGTFPSERAFYRYAARRLRAAFPRLPAREQLNRQIRLHEPLVRHVFTVLVGHLVPTPPPYEVIDTTAVPTRNVRRHGRGWLPGQADVGKSTRLGWYEGFHLLTTITPTGVLTGFGFGPASTKETPLAETFFAARHGPRATPNAVPPLAATLATGPTCPDYYLGDGGLESRERQSRWWRWYHTAMIAPPRRSAHASWPPPLRTWLATLRQIVETVYAKLHHVFRLAVERPHALSGFRARLAAMAALHNFCIWINRQLGRPDLAFADLIDW
jgi:hypothetical protein